MLQIMLLAFSTLGINKVILMITLEIWHKMKKRPCMDNKARDFFMYWAAKEKLKLNKNSLDKYNLIFMILTINT